MDKEEVAREKGIYRVTIVGSVVNFLLLLFKFFAGIMGHSAAMLADAVHSLSDFVTDIIVIVFVRISSKPEDEGHDYGHGKYETLATAIIGIILLGVGFGIFWNGASSIYRFLHGGSLQEPGMLALIAALVSVAFKEALYRYTVFKGKRLNSQAVVANAWHHRSDALSSIGTAIGIGGAILLGNHWRVLDPIAAVVVSFFIMKVAVKLLIPCVDELLEKSLPPRPGAEDTWTRSIKLCITAKPRPARSSGLPVVYIGSIALATSGIPTPLSDMVMRTLPPSYKTAVIVMGPTVSG